MHRGTDTEEPATASKRAPDDEPTTFELRPDALGIRLDLKSVADALEVLDQAAWIGLLA